MGLLRAGGKLGLEQRGHEKPVVCEFHCPGFAMLPARYHFQPGGGQLRLILRVNFIIAEELLDYFFAAIYPLQKRTGLQPDAGYRATEFGVGGAALGHCAEHGRNDDVGGVGIMFRTVGVGKLQNVAGTL
jgi:hypothetical protein